MLASKFRSFWGRGLPLALALGITSPVFAGNSLVQDAQNAWQALSAASASPPSQVSDSDAWGAPAPTQAPTRMAPDEREIDVRQKDERGEDFRQQPPPAPAHAPPAMSLKAEEHSYGIYSTPLPAPSAQYVAQGPTVDCTNATRAWEGAAALAQRGESSRAYQAYMSLLASCRDPQVLVGTAYQAYQNLTPTQIDRLVNEPVLAAPILAPALLVLNEQRMFAANKARDYAKALKISRAIRPELLDSRDSAALSVSGWLEQQAHHSGEATKLFRAALQVSPESASARQGLVYALLATNRLQAARLEAQRADGPEGELLRANVELALARQSLSQNQYAKAITHLKQAEDLGLPIDDSVLETQAWALKGDHQAAKAARIFRSLVAHHPNDSTLQQGLVDSLSAQGDTQSLATLAKEDSSLGTAARQALSQHYAAQGRREEAAEILGEDAEGERGSLSAGLEIRSKSGTPGEGQLTETILPTGTATVRIAKNTHLSVNAERLALNDGSNHSTGQELRAAVTTTQGNVQLTAGAGVSRTQGQTSATFEAKAHLYTKSGYIEAGITRTPVMDSVRSYSGVNVTNPQAGAAAPTSERVGRVFDTHVYVAGSSEVSTTKNYHVNWELGGGSVTGTNTYDDGYYRLNLSLTKDYSTPEFSWLSVGPYLKLQSYQQDENRFTGHYGGFWSPTSDTDLGFTAHFLSQEGGTLLFKGDTKLGYVNRSLYYGNDTGAELEAGGEVAWLVNPYLILGAGLSVQTSPGYNEASARLGFSIPLESRTGLYQSDLSAFKTTP